MVQHSRFHGSSNGIHEWDSAKLDQKPACAFISLTPPSGFLSCSVPPFCLGKRGTRAEHTPASARSFPREGGFSWPIPSGDAPSITLSKSCRASGDVIGFSPPARAISTTFMKLRVPPVSPSPRRRSNSSSPASIRPSAFKMPRMRLDDDLCRYCRLGKPRASAKPRIVG